MAEERATTGRVVRNELSSPTLLPPQSRSGFADRNYRSENYLGSHHLGRDFQPDVKQRKAQMPREIIHDIANKLNFKLISQMNRFRFTYLEYLDDRAFQKVYLGNVKMPLSRGEFCRRPDLSSSTRSLSLADLLWIEVPTFPPPPPIPQLEGVVAALVDMSSLGSSDTGRFSAAAAPPVTTKASVPIPFPIWIVLSDSDPLQS